MARAGQFGSGVNSPVPWRVRGVSNQDSTLEHDLLTPEEAADYLRITVRRLHQLRRSGFLTAVCLAESEGRNKTYRFPRRGLMEAIGLKGGR